MKISKNNYEVFFIDFIEGRLKETQMDEFIDFLRQNPNLKAELEMARPVKMEEETLPFPGKKNLYKEKFDRQDEFNRIAIARLEGDLTESEKMEFDHYLFRHPEKQKEVALFEQTKLKTDQNILFRKKKTLYHRSAGKTFLLWSTRIAAILILAFLVYHWAINLHSMQMTSPERIVVTEANPDEKIPVLTDPDRNKKERPNPQRIIEIQRPHSENGAISESTVNNSVNNNLQHTPKERNTQNRIQVKPPPKIMGKNVSISSQSTQLALAQKNFTKPELTEKIPQERLLAERIKNKTGLSNLTLNKIAKAGLSLMSAVSEEKFSYRTNSNGDITRLSYDSRLVAFSVPTNNK